MSDKRKLQHESIIGLINYSVLCAKTCDVLKTHDDTLTQSEETCLSKDDFDFLKDNIFGRQNDNFFTF